MHAGSVFPAGAPCLLDWKLICVLDAVRSARLAFQKRTQVRASSGGSVLARLEINLCVGCSSLSQINVLNIHAGGVFPVGAPCLLDWKVICVLEAVRFPQICFKLTHSVLRVSVSMLEPCCSAEVNLCTYSLVAPADLVA